MTTIKTVAAVRSGRRERREPGRYLEIALPNTISSSKAAPTDWRAVPSVSADFGVASADIKRRVEALIDELAKK